MSSPQASDKEQGRQLRILAADNSSTAIPGARGCTPQACSFRDRASDLRALGVAHLFGISTQSTPYQQEVQQRVHLPYQLLSDEALQLTRAMRLPTLEWEGRTLIRRLTMAIEDGRVVWVHYPVFPPDQSARAVVEWLEQRVGRSETKSVVE